MALKEGQWKVNAAVVRSVLGVAGTGKQQLAVTYEYHDEEGQRRLVTSYHFFTDAALPWTVEALRAMGWDPERNNWDVLSLDDTDILKGREVVLVLEEEEYPEGSGQFHTKVRFVNAPGGAGVERLAPDEAKAFAADLRRRLMRAAPPKASGTRREGRPSPRSSTTADRAAAPRGPAPAAPGASNGSSPPGGDEPPPDLDLDSIPF